MKEIKLKGNNVALVDDEDYDKISSYNWSVITCKTTKYAKRYCGSGYINGRSMHRMIMQPPDNLVVDHKDGNGLNNQKSNLRICTRGQNISNSSKLRKEYQNFIDAGIM